MTAVSAIIDRSLYPMRDSSQSLFVNAELIAYINDSVNDLCARERILLKTATVAASGGALDLGADYIALRWIRDPEGNEIEWGNVTQLFDQQSVSGGTVTELGAVYNEQVYIDPTPTDGDEYEVGYVATPTQLTADTDTFPLPLVWEKKVVNYVRAQAYRRLGELALSDREMADYEEGLRPASSSADRTTPGTIDMGQALGPFDVDPDAIHRGF